MSSKSKSKSNKVKNKVSATKDGPITPSAGRTFSPSMSRSLPTPLHPSHPPGFFSVPTAPVYYSTMSSHGTHSMPASTPAHQCMPAPSMPSSSPNYHISQHGGRSSVPPSSTPSASMPANQFMPTPSLPSSSPSYHISQHGGHSVIPPSSTPSASTSPSSTPSLSGMHIGDTPSPSADPSTPLSAPVHPPTQYLGDIGEEDESHRLIIAPDGNSGFIPSHKATTAVTDSIKPFYVEAWRSWKEIPWDVRDNMWRHFQTKCVWHPSYDNQMSGNFERKAQERLKGTLSAMHRSGKKPDWVIPDVWTKLNVWWETPEFKAKSEQGKSARASEKGGSLHTGGSRSVGDHRYRMEQKKGRAVSFDEVFEDLHRFKRDGKLGAWVEPRAEATHAGFKRRVEEWYQSQPASEVGSSTQPTLEEVNSLFIEEVGGPKKGRTYGLGSQYSSGPVKSGLRPTPCSSSQDSEVVDALQRKVAMLEEQRASDREQMKLLQDERASDRAQLSQLMNLVKDLASKRRSNRESDSDETD